MPRRTRSAARSSGRGEPLKTLQIYLSDLKELLQAREFNPAKACLKEVSPIDLADGWSLFTPEERAAVFRLLPRQRAIQLFEELDQPEQVALLESLQQQDAQKLLDELDPAAAASTLRSLPHPIVSRLVAIMKKGGQEQVQHYLQFPPKTVGALMRGRYITLEPKWTTRQALERIQLSTRLRRIEETHLDTLMVAEKGRLVGVVNLKELVVAPRDMLVGELMDPQPRTLRPEMDQEEAVNLFSRYKLKSAPVIDAAGRLMGVVVYRDIFEIAREETEEDFAKMAGVQAGLGHLSAYEQAKRRLPWLIITCFGGLLVSSVVHHFEDTIAQIIALATFSPLIAGMGGNVGSQTATIVVRALATGEVQRGREKVLVLKEISVGMLLGVAYGIGSGAVAYLVYGSRYGWKIGFCVAIAMWFSMTVSSTMASLEPFVLRHFGQDPATATGPLITTTTDLLSNTLYFSLARYLMMR